MICPHCSTSVKFKWHHEGPIGDFDAVDAIRNLGNLAAHPTKDKHTGEIVSVEPGEAEWLIEVIEALFDFTFVQTTQR